MTTRLPPAALLSLALAAPAAAHDLPKPPRVPAAVAHKPTAIPDRVVLTWTGDPARTQAVTWRTDDTVTEAFARVAVATAGPRFARNADTVKAATTPLRTDLGTAHYHTAVLSGLEPGTKYAYSVGDGTNWSEWVQFATAADGPEPFSFIYFGDAQNDLKAHWSRVIRQAYSDAPKARFVLHAGDLINRANSDAEWGEWFSAGGWVHATVPTLATPGNHEYAFTLKGLKASLSRHWRPQFALPENGPPGLEETAWWLDVQGVRLVSLNSNERLEDQAAWLEGVLRDNPNRWTVVTFHHPVYSSAKARDNKKLRQLWRPVLERAGVDLVLQGHDHTYGRSGLMAGDENLPVGVRNKSERGTVYVVSVSGPKMYRLEPQAWMHKSATDTQLYQIVHVDGPLLRYEARTATGELYDSFEIRKKPGGGNEMAEERYDPPTPDGSSPGSPWTAAVLLAAGGAVVVLAAVRRG